MVYVFLFKAKLFSKSLTHLAHGGKHLCIEGCLLLNISQNEKILMQYVFMDSIHVSCYRIPRTHHERIERIFLKNDPSVQDANRLWKFNFVRSW